jgi:hypothetical protein
LGKPNAAPALAAVTNALRRVRFNITVSLFVCEDGHYSAPVEPDNPQGRRAQTTYWGILES